MKFPGKQIAEVLQNDLKKDVKFLQKQGKKLKLIDILVSDAADQISFIKVKERMAQALGIDFEFLHLTKTPSFEVFANTLKKYSADPTVSGIVVQQPLPFQLQTDSLYNFIPVHKEIEGHKAKSPFCAPLGLAVLTALKFVFKDCTISTDLFVDIEKDADFFRKHLRGKKIAIVGRGITGGQPIGETFKKIRLDYFSLGSQTFEPHEYYRSADIIVTAVGKEIITADMLKPGVILLNVGLRKEDNKLKGDYNEELVKDIATMYTPTPGGIGPLDVIYLFKNIIQASYLGL